MSSHSFDLENTLQRTLFAAVPSNELKFISVLKKFNFRPAKSEVFTIWLLTENVCHSPSSSIPHFADGENRGQKVRVWVWVLGSFPTPMGGLETTETYRLSLEAGHPKSRHLQGWFPVEALRGEKASPRLS